MENEQKQTKFINYTYMLDEVIDEMERSIENVKEVKLHQNNLLEVIEADEKHDWTGFIKNLKAADEEYDNQIESMKYKLECMKEARKYCKDLSAYVVSMLLEGLGLANKEHKSVEDRMNEKVEDIKA